MKKLLYFTIMSCLFSSGMIFAAQDNRNPENPYDAACLDLETIAQIWGDQSSQNTELGLRQHIEQLKSHYQVLNNISIRLNQRIELLEAMLSASQQHQMHLAQNLEFERQNLHKVVQELTSTINELTLRKNEVQELHTTNTRLNRKQSELADKCGRLSYQLRTINAELDNAKERHLKEQQDHAQTKQRLEEVTNELNQPEINRGHDNSLRCIAVGAVLGAGAATYVSSQCLVQ